MAPQSRMDFAGQVRSIFICFPRSDASKTPKVKAKISGCQSRSGSLTPHTHTPSHSLALTRTHPLTHAAPTNTRTHPLTHSPTNSLAPTHSHTPSFPPSPTHSLSFAHPLSPAAQVDWELRPLAESQPQRLLDVISGASPTKGELGLQVVTLLCGVGYADAMAPADWTWTQYGVRSSGPCTHTHSPPYGSLWISLSLYGRLLRSLRALPSPSPPIP